ncbi:ExbD/TolR family protein [Carboxylicivirga sp. RSCT41]|uniref:ExbD/TolR family protein n=1 Tax=Carboxylicivirga agarovorans TaxID=3417570 RepID=UPI003D33C6DA
MNKTSFLFLLLVLTSCHDFELSKSIHKDRLYERNGIEYIKLKISNNNIYLNKTEITHLSEISQLAAYARDTSKEDTEIRTILYIDKNCNYFRVDSIIKELRKSAIHRYSFKTNSISESSYVNLWFGPFYADWDSLQYEMLNTTKLQRDSLNLLVINKESNKTYNLNGSILSKKEVMHKLGNSIQDSVRCMYIINPGIENTISDVIKMADLYNLVLNEKKEKYSQTKFGQSHHEIEDSLKLDIRNRFRKLINILPKQ